MSEVQFSSTICSLRMLTPLCELNCIKTSLIHVFAQFAYLGHNCRHIGSKR